MVLINAASCSRYATERLPDGSTAIDRVAAFARTLPGATDIRWIVGPGIDPGDEHHTIKLASDSASALLELFPTEGLDDVFYLYADTPLLDREIVGSLYDQHDRYLAHYSFADGYPYGLVPEIVSCDAVPKLRALAAEHQGPVERDTLFSVIQKDINSFDIETHLSPLDQRLLRVSLAADNRRNFLILERIMAAGGLDAESVSRVLEEQPQLLRSVPAYISVQVIDGCPQACSYCPFPKLGGNPLEQRNEMQLDSFKRIIGEVSRFCEDAVINLSVWGEPSLHSGISDIAAEVLSHDGLSLLVETSGIGWPEGTIETIAQAGGNRVTWIVSIDSIDPGLYGSLRGKGFKRAMATAELLLSIAPETTHIQSVRMQENEEHLEAFYRYWKERTEHVIIQKYSRFGGVLPERKVTDISPLHRFPCWHLKRDLVVLLDGSVPVCREDVQQTEVLGNIFHESIEEIWNRGEAWYRRHLEADYPDICRNCDEYYTFNS